MSIRSFQGDRVVKIKSTKIGAKFNITSESKISSKSNKKFSDVVKKIDLNKPQQIKPTSFSSLMSNLQTKIKKGVKIKPSEMLVYQIQAGEMNLKVELVSKVVDAASATLKKLQSSKIGIYYAC